MTESLSCRCRNDGTGKGGGAPMSYNTRQTIQVDREPLYGGKGKCSGLIYNHCDIVPTIHDHAGGHPRPGKMNGTPLTVNPGTGIYVGLNQPLLASDSVVLGEDKTQMHRKNKQQRQALRAKQPLISPWTRYQGMMETLDPTNHTTCPSH
jgi:hypothetical protein